LTRQRPPHVSRIHGCANDHIGSRDQARARSVCGKSSPTQSSGWSASRATA
jgi:hypothetical protein